MAEFRIDKLAELCRQMPFVPQRTRTRQLAAAEGLLAEVDPAKAYPLDFIIFRITGYHPRIADQPLLTGLALQHDIGLLIEKTSETLELDAGRAGQPVLTIEDVAARFNVTTKTIQRWRRRGLGARRFVFADGKRRVGFLLATVERFLAAQRDQPQSGANFADATPAEMKRILRQARRLLERGCSREEICRRVGRRVNRVPLAIGHCLKAYDQAHGKTAVLARATPSLTDSDRKEVLRCYQSGELLRCISSRLQRPQADVYRAIVEERFARLNRRKVRFIDDPLYHETSAADIIAQIVSQRDVMASPRAEELRIPRDLPPYLADLYRTPLLSPARERALFLKFHFHKYQFVAARRKIDPTYLKARDVRELETCRRAISETKNEIVRANLRLVVSVARKHLRAGLSLMELISEGNLTLMRAVESFDVHKGNRFSTYATLALMKGFARSVPQMMTASARAAHGQEAVESLASRPAGDEPARRLVDRDQVQQLLSRLEPRERAVILAHYGLGDALPSSYEQVGNSLGLSKQRVRQIEQSAFEKLRAQCPTG